MPSFQKKIAGISLEEFVSLRFSQFDVGCLSHAMSLFWKYFMWELRKPISKDLITTEPIDLLGISSFILSWKPCMWTVSGISSGEVLSLPLLWFNTSRSPWQ